ncbi:cysteine hydrolase family protein [Clostridium akagii]|uniref:cysteine hydrolase family protein n=1 Tax=Clostridium akagii TaxID=91623 RepID=UPI00047D06B5|nr:cysteine hydrolase family protein [Clostridium akagii]
MNTVLILIDIQNEYFQGGKSELNHTIETANRAKVILDFFRKNSLHVFHVKHIVSGNKAKAFLQDSIGAEINYLVTPREDEKVFIKHVPNSFFETGLDKTISDNNINHIVVCGMMTHMCIDTTVRYAKELGLIVTLIEDACTTKDLTRNGNTIPAEIVQATYMASLDGMFAKVMTAEEFLQSSNVIC